MDTQDFIKMCNFSEDELNLLELYLKQADASLVQLDQMIKTCDYNSSMIIAVGAKERIMRADNLAKMLEGKYRNDVESGKIEETAECNAVFPSISFVIAQNSDRLYELMESAKCKCVDPSRTKTYKFKDTKINISRD